jgi:hypothetical protein
VSNPVPVQHAGVVLRSTSQHLRALLAIGTIVIVGLTVAVVVLAINGSASTTVSRAARVTSSAIRVNPSQVVRPNPDEQRVSPATRATSSVIQATPSPVQPNPDEQGLHA